MVANDRGLWLDRVSVVLKQPSGPPAPIIRETTIRIAPQEIVTLVGVSGAGKSTLLRIAASLLKPTSGRVVVEGKVVIQPDRRRGIVFQDYRLLPWRSVLENVCLPLEIEKLPRDQRTQQARAILELLGLSQFERLWVHQLSGGMRQRVAVARAMVTRPTIVLLDEPTAALDHFTKIQVREKLREAFRVVGQTALIVTHDVQEAAWLGDRVIVFSERPGHVLGEILSQGMAVEEATLGILRIMSEATGATSRLAPVST